MRKLVPQARKKEKFDHFTLWSLTIPIILANATIPLLGMVDIAVAARVAGQSAISAVSVGVTIFSVFYWGFGFLRMGVSGLAAVAKGAEDHQELKAIFYRASFFALAGGIVIILLGRPLVLWSLEVFSLTAPSQTQAVAYCLIRLWSAPATLLCYTIFGWLIGMGQTRNLFILQLALTCLNGIFDIWFGYIWQWGVEGIALGTVLAESMIALVGGLCIWRNLLAGAPISIRAGLFNPAGLMRMFRVNRDIMFRNWLLLGALALLPVQGSYLGEEILAINTILFQFVALASFGLDGFAFAAEGLVGQAIGRGARDEFDHIVKKLAEGIFILAIILCLFFALAGVPLFALLAGDAISLTDVYEYLPWAVFCPIFGAGCYLLDGIFIGAVRSRELRNAMAISFLLYVLCLFVFVHFFANHGLWAAFYFFLLIRFVALAWFLPRLRQGFKAPGP